jgi:hypothetical protein
VHDGEKYHRRRSAHEEGDNPFLKVIQNFIHGISPDPCLKKTPVGHLSRRAFSVRL